MTCSIDDWRPDEFDKGLAQVASAATYLGSRGVDFIIHGGGPLVVARGAGYEDIIVQRRRGRRKVQATTSIRAGMEALRHAGARRIAIASPYPKRHNDALTAHLTANGFEVVARRGHGPAVQGDAEPAARRHPDIRRQRAGRAPRIARRSTCPARNGRRRRPWSNWNRTAASSVVAYTHACFFVAFKAMGLTDAIRGHGRLLASLASAS